MDHNGEFGGFLKEVRENGGMQSEPMNQSGSPTALSFDGSPVYDDLAVLNRWLTGEEREANSAPRLFNLLLLHDGKLHFPACVISKTADYKKSARRNCSMNWTPSYRTGETGRKVMVVVVPEHGGALKGDRMQILACAIPQPLTNVPARA